MEDKESFRSKIRNMRKQQTAVQADTLSRHICSVLISRLSGDLLQGNKIIAVYLARQNEISLDAFIEYALKKGIALVAPRWNGERYDLAELSSLSAPYIALGPMRIREPAPTSPIVSPGKVGIWLVPGLCFTRSGKRIGYGGGWYDRLLSGAGAGTIKVGIAASYQIFEDLPTGETDIAMDYCITEKSQ